jgi:glycosyltransferase involved in cell wall biosynthesis
MAFDLLKVCVFGCKNPEWLENLRLRGMRPEEASGFDVHTFDDDAQLEQILVDLRPQVLVSFGQPETYHRLWAAPLDVRLRWINIDDPLTPPETVADRIMETYIGNVTEERFPASPLVSVFTPTYLTGEKIKRPLQSLLSQSYAEWEWIIFDDSPDDGRTFSQMAEIAGTDRRISAYRADRPSGSIGEVKRRACGLARGAILLELDHDDALTPGAIASVVEAFREFPDAGFFYTDCAEVFENGESATYGEGWGMGFGSYRVEQLDGKDYVVTNYPSVNAKTIRHIVGVPNHLRAWTKEAYWRSGGHNPDVPVGDDYELLIRTFLTTRMVHIQRFGYIQYHNNSSSGNTQRHRNAEIQRMVRYFADHYNKRIHKRFRELGVDDFIWHKKGKLDWDAPVPTSKLMANYVMA